MPAFTGVIPILATPFADDESLDLESWRRLIEFMCGLGVNGITILGVLGESNRLSDAERAVLIETAVSAVGGRMPIIVGVSHSGTYVIEQLSGMARHLGADAVMVTPSKEPVPGEERIVEMYQRLAERVALPIVLQDHPASSEVHMSVPLMARLVKTVPSIAGIKEEAVPTAPKIRQLREALGDRRVPVLTGLGALYAPFDLEAGSDGFNTGFAFPEVLLAMIDAARGGDWARVHALYSHFAALMVFEQQPGVAVRKELLRRRGLLASARVRHPGASATAAVAEELDSLLRRILPGVDLTRPIAVDQVVAAPAPARI
jgi:4-hydroxy-tetrahydrodipicolinate synthase